MRILLDCDGILSDFHAMYLPVVEKITEIAPTFEKQSVLDVGCGTGDMVRYLPKTCKYLGIDIYRPALKIAKKQYPNQSFKFGNILTFKSRRIHDNKMTHSAKFSKTDEHLHEICREY